MNTISWRGHACSLLVIGSVIIGLKSNSVAADSIPLVEIRFDGETRNWGSESIALESASLKFAVDRFGSESHAATFPESGFIGSLGHGYLKNRKQWTWSGWIRPKRTDLENRVIYSEDHRGNVADIQLDRDRLRVSTWNEDEPGNWTSAISTKPLAANVWTHIAVIYSVENGTGTVGTCTIYQDGQPTFAGSLPMAKASGPAAGFRAFAIGSNIGSVTANQPNQQFEGSIDDVLIFDHSVSGGGIPELMQPNKRLMAFAAVEIEVFGELGNSYQLQ